MWEEILKRKSSVESRNYYRNVFYNVMSNYIIENYESGKVISIPEIRNKLNEIKELCLEVIVEERGKMTKGPFSKWFDNKIDYQISAVLNKMIRLGLMEPGGERKLSLNSPVTHGATDTGGSRAGERGTTYILKGRRDNYPLYRDALHRAAIEIMQKEPSGKIFTVADIILKEEEIVELSKTFIPINLLGGFAQFRKNKFKGQMQTVVKKLVANGIADRTESSRPSFIMKGWQPGPKPKKLTPEMEEDIDEAVADNEFAVSDKISDKVKHILMQPRDGEPAKSKKDIREFNRRFPGIKTNIEVEDDDIEEMDSGCGCGCDGKEVSKASSQCTKRTKKTSSTRKGKKWMACVPNGKGGYKRVHWGQRGVSVTGKRGNTKRKKSFRARHKCSTCKGGDYSARCMACKDW